MLQRWLGFIENNIEDSLKMFLQMSNILFRWAPLPGWTRSWPRSREREVGWRGRGPSSLRGRQGREQDDDHNVEDHVGEEDDDDVDDHDNEDDDHNVEEHDGEEDDDNAVLIA